MSILPIGNSRLEPLNEQLPSNFKTPGVFPPLRVGGVGGADGERAGVRCAFIHLRVHGEGFGFMGRGRAKLQRQINFNVPVLRNGIQRVVYTNDSIAMTSGAPAKEKLGDFGALAV